MRLFKHPRSGYWYIEFSRGDSKSLKTKNGALAREAFRLAAAEQVLGRVSPLARRQAVALDDFSEEYLRRDRFLAKNTLRIDGEVLDKLKAFLRPGICVHEITPAECERFVASLCLKPNTINIHLRHLKAAMNKAVKWGYADTSPFAGIPLIKVHDDEPRALTAEEVEKLLDAIDDPEFKRYVYTCLYTGGRRESAAKLQWEDIRKYGDNYSVRLKLTKGRKPVTIPLAGKLRSILFARKQERGPVFPRYNVAFREASRDFRTFADKAGLHGVKLHDLRHTCGTWMIIKGVPAKVVQKILGHSSSKMTDIYTKIAGKYLQGATDVLDF